MKYQTQTNAISCSIADFSLPSITNAKRRQWEMVGLEFSCESWKMSLPELIAEFKPNTSSRLPCFTADAGQDSSIIHIRCLIRLTQICPLLTYYYEPGLNVRATSSDWFTFINKARRQIWGSKRHNTTCQATIY